MNLMNIVNDKQGIDDFYKQTGKFKFSICIEMLTIIYLFKVN
jgi:hypothetical protein